MKDVYKLSIELLNEARLIDFDILKDMILETLILNTAFNKILVEKGIISKQEFDAAVWDVKPQFSDLKNEIAKNKKEHEKRASEIYEILEENNKNQEETMNFLQDVLGISI